MAATDSKGNTVGLGDVILAHVWADGGQIAMKAITIVKLSETPRGVSATGAYVEVVGHGRVAKTKVDIGKGTLVLRRDGSGVVRDTAALI